MKPGGSQRRLARNHIAIQEQEHGQAAKPAQAMRTNSKERFPPEKIFIYYARGRGGPNGASYPFIFLTLPRSTRRTGRITFFCGIGSCCNCFMIISVARMPF